MNTIANILNKRPPILTYSKSNLYILTFQEIAEILNSKTLHLPEIQGDLNQDKVDEMINSYKNTHHFMASKAIISITKICIADAVEFGLIDGQHRSEMIKEMYEKDKVSDKIIVSIINVESQEELNKLFLEINTDSSKCIYKNLTIFDKQIYEDLKKQINNDTHLLPLKKSNYASKVYTSTQFVSNLIDNKIIEKLRENNLIENTANSFLKFLKLKERQFFNLYKYDSKVLDKKPFKKDELDQINLKSCIFIKNNNFLEWIFDDTIEPDHDFNTRPDIKPKLRKEVWDEEYTKKVKSHVCPIIGCKNIMTEKDTDTWHCGHIKSFMNKGPTDLTNLKPLCPPCNKKMNYRDWEEWENEQINNYILKEYFIDSKKTKCKNIDCENTVTKKNFKAQRYDNNTAKPWCIDCYNKLNDLEEDDEEEVIEIPKIKKVNVKKSDSKSVSSNV